MTLYCKSSVLGAPEASSQSPDSHEDNMFPGTDDSQRYVADDSNI